MHIQRSDGDKFCNCRNSKCMKLYCECFAARVECGKNCHCIDCHNRHNSEHFKLYKEHHNSQRKTFKDQFARQHKGCACRKSGCTKKYCQCYQAGLLCRDICKCVQCQNNESLSNKKVISQLKRTTSPNNPKSASLYPIILTQDNRHLNQILADENPLNIHDQWIQQTAQELFKTAHLGSFPSVIEKLIDVLALLQNDQHHIEKEELMAKSEPMDEEDLNQDEDFKEEDDLKEEDEEEDSSQMMEQEDAQSPLSYQNLKSSEQM